MLNKIEFSMTGNQQAIRFVLLSMRGIVSGYGQEFGNRISGNLMTGDTLEKLSCFIITIAHYAE